MSSTVTKVLIDGRSFRAMCRELDFAVDYEALEFALMELSRPHTLAYPTALTVNRQDLSFSQRIRYSGFETIIARDKDDDRNVLVRRIAGLSNMHNLGRVIFAAPDAFYVGHLDALHSKTNAEIVILATDQGTSKLSFEMRMACANRFRLVNLAELKDKISLVPARAASF
jgi:hypothetical protein